MLSMNSQGNSFNIPCYFTSKPYSSTINSSVQCSCSFSGGSRCVAKFCVIEIHTAIADCCGCGQHCNNNISVTI
ncbi:hypothetical protein glysoja_048643 [Glycine soja]|uniref:Uncharacterized protein n=1 Tax=Glycine soja TaxID=3848 RepID=A0A0B2SIN6_GLYSO|nr:hypothetical protein glysoja_048643 [Glycine soja]